MAIHRDKEHVENYLMVHNDAINSYGTLSIEAMGALVYFLAKPAGWRPNVSELAKTWGFGRDKAHRIMKELKEAGYVKKSFARTQSGQFVTSELHVCETPRNDSEALEPTLPDNVVEIEVSEKPETGKHRHRENTDIGKSRIAGSADTINNRVLIKDEEKKTRAKVDPLEVVIDDRVDEQAWREWWDYKPGKKQDKASVTKTMNILKEHTPDEQRRAVDASIAAGWKGLFPKKESGNETRQQGNGKYQHLSEGLTDTSWLD